MLTTPNPNSVPITLNPQIEEIFLNQEDYIFMLSLTVNNPRVLNDLNQCLSTLEKIRNKTQVDSEELIAVLGYIKDKQVIQTLFTFLRKELKKVGLYFYDMGDCYATSQHDLSTPEGVLILLGTLFSLPTDK